MKYLRIAVLMWCIYVINFGEVISPNVFRITLSDIIEEDKSSDATTSFSKSSKFLRGLLCAVLEDTIQQLQILSRCSNKMTILGPEGNLPDSLEELLKLKENSEERTIMNTKLMADRKFISKVIQNTYLELIEHNHFSYLKENVERCIDLENYPYDLLIEKEKNKTVSKNLAKQVRLQRNHIKAQLYEINVVIENRNMEIEDSYPKNEIKRRYIENWQAANMEQHILTIAKKEEIPRSSISDFKDKYGREVIVHSEVERLIKIQVNETLSRIDAFMTKYDKDIEDMDVKIQISKNTYYETVNKRIEMEEMLENRANMIINWTKFKEEREFARRYKENMTNAALAIQAWWRGLLVRLKRGPFAEKKKKKKLRKV